MKDTIRTCRHCGKPIAVISWGIYRSVVVDAAAVMVKADPDGEDFVRIDGSKVKATPVAFEDGWDAEPAYRMHRKTCSRRRS